MSKTWSSHAEMVSKLAKPGVEVLKTLTAEKVDLWHAVTGIVTEAGELMDAVKKHVIYDQPFNLANGAEELGDIEFYMEEARQNLHLLREAILEGNMRKLEKRYGEKYSDQAAQERKDKQNG